MVESVDNPDTNLELNIYRSPRVREKEVTKRICPSGQMVTLSAPGGGREVEGPVEAEGGHQPGHLAPVRTYFFPLLFHSSVLYFLGEKEEGKLRYGSREDRWMGTGIGHA